MLLHPRATHNELMDVLQWHKPNRLHTFFETKLVTAKQFYLHALAKCNFESGCEDVMSCASASFEFNHALQNDKGQETTK